MSRLKELRLHGFKTFADPTRFVFDPGVNAVIGPNGSGKSNMADAVRWVLGEQSNRSLRTRRADDVIFAGSEHRRPQGMAEAILTLDNADGWLPIAFEEVSIGRRAYRSGEGEYLINGARARLRDVVELLGEGRLGANELVVVGQGTVDAALSLRPEERRQLFEEAAGVKNLQVRKNEALARLARARDNLTRVTDLIGELKPQVRRLGLQAQHQQEHDNLGRAAHALVVESHRRREQHGRSTLGDARRRGAAAEADLQALRAEQEAGQAALRSAEERYWQAETAARATADERERTRELLIRAESRAEAVASRVTEAQAAIATAERDLVEAEAALSGDRSEETEAGLGPALEAAVAAEERWREASSALAAADARLLAAEESLADARRAESARIAAQVEAGERLAGAQARHERIAAELATTREALAAAEAELPAADDRSTRSGTDLSAARERHDQALAGLDQAQPAADAARRSAAELAERVGALRGELDALSERAERGGRLGSLLTAAGWPTLLDTLPAPEETWPAIEAVVGGELEHALVWRDGEIAHRLADARGAARLLTTGTPLGLDDERVAALAAVNADGTLADWLGNGTTPLVFHRVAVAPDVEALLGGWRNLPPGWLAVTRHGDLADGRGLVAVRGRQDGPSGESARRHARRRELVDLLAAAESEHQVAAADAAARHAAVSEAHRRHQAARDELSATETTAHEARTALDRLAATRDELAAEVARLVEALARSDVNRTPSAATPAPSPASPSIGEREREAADARAARDRAAAAREQAREAWRGLQAAADELDGRVTGGQRGRAQAEARRAQVAAQLPGLRAARERLQAELTEAQAAATAVQTADEEAGERRAGAEAERERLRAELLELERAGGGAVARLMELEQAAHAAALDVTRAEEALAAVARERELALASLPELPEPVEGTTADDADSRAAALDDEALDHELRQVRRTLTQIGSVNPFAVEEHRELSARLDGLSDQDRDLSAAIDSTEALIGQLDSEITARFHAAFVAIGERFDEYCRLLFAGGSASLQLGDAEDGEAPGGIEIVVRPPGKRLQRLAMLSGGERALTGVALLFAMLSVNPVPFCILDEVDAALDEANIGRFAAALRRLAEQIDFVVITHNRATIEVADTIYGVTMTDAAVSRVVSLRLADLPAESMAAEVPAT